jgi:hypothetical protein
LYILKWNLKVSNLPEEEQQRAVEFPRYQLKQIISQLCTEAGITVIEKNTETVEEEAENPTDKAKRARSLPGCPICGSEIDWKPGSLCLCKKVGKDGRPCLFGAFLDEWRAINVLSSNKIDISKAMEYLEVARAGRRRHRETNRDYKATKNAKILDKRLTDGDQ